MARFLFSVWPYAGHVHPSVALAIRLRARGHEVAFFTGSSGAAPAKSEGFYCFGFDRLARYLSEVAGARLDDEPELYQLLNRRYTTAGESALGRLAKIRALFEEMTLGSIPAQLEDIARIGRDWKPDAIISDAMFWGPILVSAERTGVPVVPFSFYAGCLIPGRDTPPMGLGFPPAQNLISHFRNSAFVRLYRALTAGIRKSANRVRTRYGLPSLQVGIHEHSGRMPLYLVASSPEFDYARGDLPPSVAYVGPCLWEPHLENAMTERAGGLIYVSEGTAQVGKPFLIAAALDGLAGEPYRIVITTGRHRDASSLGCTVPPNAEVRQWVSQRDLFVRCRAVVSVGGSNTVRQSLACGVPVVISPLEWDQLENAARAEWSGAGVRIPARRCSAVRIRDAVRTVIADPRYAASANRIARSFAAAEVSSIPLERLEQVSAQRTVAGYPW